MARIITELDWDYVECEADGSICMQCEDVIYLRSFKIELYSAGTKCKITEVDGRLCGSCGDALKTEKK